MDRLLLLPIISTIGLSALPANAMTLSGATDITNANAAMYQEQEIGNIQPIKVLNSLVTTRTNNQDSPLRIKANFDNISGKIGSAVYNYGYLDLLSGSTFTNNKATTDGGSIYVGNTSLGTNIYNTRFSNNISGRNGGAIYVNKTTLNIFGGSEFYNNSAAKNGGAIYLNNGILNFNTNGGDIIFSANTVANQPNDIFMNGSSILNINGSHALVLDGGINNLDSKSHLNTIINNNGILDINTAKIYAGNVNFSSPSALYVKIKSDNNYGQIFANNINIAPDAKIKITVSFAAGNNNKDFIANILNASDNLNGEFNQIKDIVENNLYEITYLDNGRYQITKKPNTENNETDHKPDTSANSKPYNPGDAWLDNGNFTPGSSAANTAEHLYELKQTDTDAYEAAIKAITPSSATVVQNTISQINKQVLSAVSSQLSGGASGLSAGKSAGDSLFYRMRSWVKLLNNHARLSGNDGFSSSTNGVSLGVDKLVSDNLRIGVGYAYNTGTIDSFQRDTDLNGHTAILYGEYKPSDWFINSIITYNHSQYRENKNLSGLLVKSKYSIDNFGVQIMNGIETGIFTPQVGLRYAYFNRPRYQDTAGQSIEGDNSQTLTAIIGSKIAHDFLISRELVIRPELKLAVTYDLLNENNNTLVYLPNGAAYETQTRHLNRIGFELGGAFHFNLLETTDISLGYEGRFRKDYQDHSGILDIKYNF